MLLATLDHVQIRFGKNAASSNKPIELGRLEQLEFELAELDLTEKSMFCFRCPKENQRKQFREKHI